MFPEIDRLPCTQQQSAVVNTQAHGLGGECCADMGWHVVITFVVVQVTSTPAVWSARSSSVLRHHGIHPGLQIFQDPWIGVFIDGEAAAGVQAGEMHHPGHQTGLVHPLIQLSVQGGETRSVRVDLQLRQQLIQRHAMRPASLSLARP